MPPALIVLSLSLGACTLNFDRYLPGNDPQDGGAMTDALTQPDRRAPDAGPVLPPPSTCANAERIPAEGGVRTLYLRADYEIHRFPCGSGARPAQYFLWTPPRSGRADIQAVGQRVNMQAGTAVDVMLDLRTDECPDGGAVACNDDSTPPGDNGARLQPMVSAGQSYYVVVGSYSPTPQPNPITLTVTAPP